MERFRGPRKLGLALATVVVLCTPGVASAQPTNSGVVRVDGVPIEDIPLDESHAGCTFQIDFFAYDQGDLFATVTFQTLAPHSVQTLLTDTVFIGEDDSTGGTGEAGLDASQTYTLDLTGIEPTPQGVHVQLTVNADGSQGADTKFATFWIVACGGPAPTATVTPTTAPPTSTFTATPPPTSTFTATTTPTSISTSTPTATPTQTSIPTATSTPTNTAIPSATAIPGPPPGTIPTLSFPMLALLAVALASAALFLIRRP